MENLLCMSKPATEYAVFDIQDCPSINNNADGDAESSHQLSRSTLHTTNSSASSMSVSSSSVSMSATPVSTVTNEEIKEFLEQMKWHINNKLDRSRLEMLELKMKVDAMDAKLNTVLMETGRNGSGPHPKENGSIETARKASPDISSKGGKGGEVGDGGGDGDRRGGIVGGIRRGNNSLAKSIKGVFMNSNNNKQQQDKQPSEEEDVDKRKMVTFGQDVVVQEIHRVLSSRKNLKKVMKIPSLDDNAILPEESEDLEVEKLVGNGREMVGVNDEEDDVVGEYTGETIDDFTDSDEEESQEIRVPSPGAIDPAELRKASWRMSQIQEPVQNNYQNSPQACEDTYEMPIQEQRPALPPMVNRPPINKTVSMEDPQQIYETPDDSATESGRGSMAPGSVSDEGSGGSFIFPQTGSDSFNDYDSEGSTDYEDMDEDLPEDKITEKQKKPKINKFEEFKKMHDDYDLIGILFSYGNLIGTMKAGNFLAKWEKRYCMARDMELVLYKSYKDKKPQKMPLMGYEVYLLGQQCNRDHVFRINHSSMKNPMLFATDSRADSEKWVSVLSRYATIDHTIVPTSGYTLDREEQEDGGTSKKGGFFHIGKKDKESAQQITIDEQDNLSGYVNIVGARYGEPKVKRKWITIQGNAFACAPSKEEPTTFSFGMAGITVDTADKKEAKMKNGFKISRDSEVLLYVEAPNKVDAGLLLKKLVEIMAKKPDRNSVSAPNPVPEPEQRKATEGIVARLMANFESMPSDNTDGNVGGGSVNGVGGQRLRKTSSVDDKTTSPAKHSAAVEDELYDDVDLPEFESKPSPVKNLKKFATLPAKLKTGKRDIEKDIAPPLPDSAPGEKKETEKERKAREKKEKKEREKEDKEREKREKKEKDEKKKKEKEERKKKEAAAAAQAAAEAAAREAEEHAAPGASASTLPSVPAPAPELPPTPPPSKEKEKSEPEKKEDGHAPLQRRTTAAAMRLGDHSGTSHLIIKDQLMQDRKDLEIRQKEALKKKTELRNQMHLETDPGTKAVLKQELEVAQKEWSDLNKELVEVSRKIEEATLGNDVNANKTAATTKKPTVRPASPDREKVSAGTVSDRMKMFQGK